MKPEKILKMNQLHRAGPFKKSLNIPKGGNQNP